MTSILPALHSEAAREQQLIAALRGCATRDIDALRELYELTAPRLLGQLVQMLGDPADAEDALQESFASIWHKAALFSAARSKPLDWVLSIARHQAIDRLQARRSAPPDSLEALPPDLFDTDLPATDVALQRCLPGISPEEQRCLRLAYVTGQSSDEIARQLQLPPAATRHAIHRGLRAMGKCIDSNDALDYVASAYALGTLPWRARRRFASLLRQDLAARRALQKWDQHLAGLAADVPPARPSDSTLPAILARIQPRAARGRIGPRRWALITALVLAVAVVLLIMLVKRGG